jgi:hypothetical protein
VLGWVVSCCVPVGFERRRTARGKKTLSYMLDSGVLEVEVLVCACVCLCESLQCYGVKAEVIGIFRRMGS